MLYLIYSGFNIWQTQFKSKMVHMIQGNVEQQWRILLKQRCFKHAGKKLKVSSRTHQVHIEKESMFIFPKYLMDSQCPVYPGHRLEMYEWRFTPLKMNGTLHYAQSLFQQTYHHVFFNQSECNSSFGNIIIETSIETYITAYDAWNKNYQLK